MEESLLTRFADRLRREEAELEEQLEAYNRESAFSLKDSVQELSSYDNHPADLASETFERSKDLALLDNARALQNQVRMALRRIDVGTYGLCAKCGLEISRERLEAIPHASLCLDCQKHEEALNPPRQRPIEEMAVSPPDGHGFRDPEPTPAYDGEDIWRDVARHGTSSTPSDIAGTELDEDERDGLVEETDGIIDVGPDEIPPDPALKKI